MPSVMQRLGTPNSRHNLDNKYRRHLENVDSRLSKYNEVIRGISVEDIYDKYLQPAYEKYNNKQKRKDRRYDVKYGCSTYLEYQRELDKRAKKSKNEIEQKGRPPIREIIWQFGNPEQGYGCAGQTEESRNEIKGMLLEVQAEAERRYPQFIWGDLVFHADEVSLDADDKEVGSIHLHASFVPLCYQNKQGTEVQVAFERCLREMGFATFHEWKHDLDNIMEEVLEKHGLERTVMDNSEKHQDSKEFHRQQKLIKETKRLERENQKLQKEKKELLKENEDLKSYNKTLEEEVEKALSLKWQRAGELNNLRLERKEILQELESFEQRAQELVDFKIELPEVPIPENKVEFVEWCMRHLEGVFKAIDDFCRKKYQEFQKNRQESILKAADGLKEQGLSILDKINHARVLADEHNKNIDSPSRGRNDDLTK